MAREAAVPPTGGGVSPKEPVALVRSDSGGALGEPGPGSGSARPQWEQGLIGNMSPPLGLSYGTAWGWHRPSAGRGPPGNGGVGVTRCG